MTCIVGITDGDRVFIGGDSAGVAGYDITLRKDPKVFKNGDFLIGYTSSFRMGQLLRYQCNFTSYHPDFYDDEYHYMCTTFIEEVRSVLKDYGYTTIDANNEAGGVFLVGFNGKIFRVDYDFHVGESLKCYDSIGCGKDYALGCLFGNEGDLKSDPKHYINLVLKAAEEFSGGVRSPFIILEN
jgi:hypothetical protein